MFSDYPNMESWLQAQEGMSITFHARLREVGRDKAEIISITDLKAKTRAFESTVRFQHVRGIIAEIKAGNAEIKNMLATIIAKLG
jgi:hypothetical protein